MAKKIKIQKEDFIQMLASMTKEEMYEYIKEKSKPKKLVWLYHIFNRGNISKK